MSCMVVFYKKLYSAECSFMFYSTMGYIPLNVVFCSILSWVLFCWMLPLVLFYKESYSAECSSMFYSIKSYIMLNPTPFPRFFSIFIILNIFICTSQHTSTILCWMSLFVLFYWMFLFILLHIELCKAEHPYLF